MEKGATLFSCFSQALGWNQVHLGTHTFLVCRRLICNVLTINHCIILKKLHFPFVYHTHCIFIYLKFRFLLFALKQYLGNCRLFSKLAKNAHMDLLFLP